MNEKTGGYEIDELVEGLSRNAKSYTDEEDFYSEENLSQIKETMNADNEDEAEEVQPRTYSIRFDGDENSEEEGTSEGDEGSDGKSEDSDEESEDTDEENEDTDEENEDIVPKTYTFSLGEGIELETEDSEDENLFSPEERLRGFADSLLSACFGNREISNYAIEKLVSLNNPRIFRDENYVILSVLSQFRGKLRTINIDEEFLKLYLNRNKLMLQKAKGFIDINAYGEVDGSSELGYIGGVIKHFRRLLTLPSLSEMEYNTIYEKYLIEYKSMEAEKAYNQAQVLLSEGLSSKKANSRTKEISSFDVSHNFIRRRLAEIEGIGENQKGTGFTSQREILMQEKSAKKSFLVSDFDRLTALNDVYGGIYSGTFYQVIAPPKTGKTKFLSRIVHTTSVKFGNNVTVWAHEGGKDNFVAEQRAIHFDHFYNSGKSITERKWGIDQDVIIHDKYPSDELKQLEMSSKIDLASNADYGSVDYIDRPFNVETFIDDIDTSVKSNQSQLIVIDYLQLIGSENPNKSERERVADAYKKALKYARDNNIAIITVGQYKQEAFEKLIEKGNTAEAEMRTSGGVSSEVLRTPDIIIAFWASTQDLLNNSMKILSMPCRFNKPFPEINVALDLGVCQYVSV